MGRASKNPLCSRQRLRWCFSLLLLLLLAGCTPHKDLVKVKNKEAETKDFASVFHNRLSAHILNMSIQFKESNFSGLLVVRPMEDNSHRIVFTTKMGNKLFDFLLPPQKGLQVNSCIDPLNKKLLLYILEQDLRLLVNSYWKQKVRKEFVAKGEEHQVFKIKSPSSFLYYYFDAKKEKEIRKIEKASRLSKKVIVTMDDYKEEFPSKIRIEHQHLKLSLEMKLLSVKQ